MSDRVFRCQCCGRLCPVRVAGQRFCGRQRCQRARKNAWRRSKYAGDADYRANQADSTHAWLERRGGAASYYREYRRKQKARRGTQPAETAAASPSATRLPDAQLTEQPAEAMPPGCADERTNRDASSSANSDAECGKGQVFPGTYRLIPLEGANSDAILVNLRPISAGCDGSQIST